MSNIGYQTVEYWDSNIGLSSLFSKIGKFKDIGFGPQELYDYFTFKYFDRPMARPYDSEGAAAIVEWYKKMVWYTMVKNSYKYDTLLKTVGIDYNPIENFRVEEITGEFTKIGDTRQVNRADQNSGPTSENWTTQYNNDTPVLASQAKSYGETATTVSHDGLDDTIAAKDNAYGTEVNDIDQYGGKKTIRTGTTGKTIQEMIENEREIAYLDIIEEFLGDIKKEILLGIYAE